MKKIINIYIFVLIMISSSIYSQEEYFFGANANYLIPIGSFSNRFENSVGTTIYFGKKISTDFSWVGKLDYMKFDKLNNEKLSKKVSAEINDVKLFYNIPLEKLEMEFEAIGLLAEAKWGLVNSSFGEISLAIGFGFYQWESFRSSYIDTISVIPSEGDSPIVIKEFNVPENNQKDWSGGINLGLAADINIIGPLQFNIGGYYKIIIGELWPALSLDIENVSGIQMLNISAGLKYSL